MPYADTILAARRRVLADWPAVLRLRMGRRLVEEFDAVLLRYLRGEVTEGAARQMTRDLARALSVYAADAEGEVKRSLLSVMDQTVAAHRQALQEIQGAPRTSFAGVPVEALEQMYLRREMGLVRSFKTLSRYQAEQYATRIERALEQAVAQGESYTTATQRIAKALAQGDPYLARIAERYGERGGLRRWARAAGIEPDPGAAQVARRLGYDARRIAVTEIAQAYHSADAVASARSPVVAGLRWTLSPFHPEPDVCDALARMDVYGLGGGVYPAENLPALPHPFCMCSNRHALRPESEWGNPKPDPELRAFEPSEVAATIPGGNARDVQMFIRGIRAAQRVDA